MDHNCYNNLNVLVMVVTSIYNIMCAWCKPGACTCCPALGRQCVVQARRLYIKLSRMLLAASVFLPPAPCSALCASITHSLKLPRSPRCSLGHQRRRQLAPCMHALHRALFFAPAALGRSWLYPLQRQRPLGPRLHPSVADRCMVVIGS
jgi:hypothetical protein